MMQIFTQYIEPLTTWLHLHPQSAIFITFFIAFLESVAIIGSIIPGSITMTAIGILAGSGIIPIGLTLLAATLGAIAGDTLSYLLGYVYSERLVTLWPFSHYPNLFVYGQHYFEKHGGKSVLIGRFIGPLRSIIPVIAGMMHMSKIRFLIANILSGVGWAILYITPGVMIGAASHELSPERATRLVVLVLFVLISIWLLTLGIKALFIHFKNWFQKQVDIIWSYCLKTPVINPLFKLLTPKKEVHHAHTATLFMLLLLSIGGFVVLTYLRAHYPFLDNPNQAVHFFLQSIRTHPFETFFGMTYQSLQPIPVITLFVVTVVFLIFERDLHAVLQWLVFALLSVSTIYELTQHLPVIAITSPNGILSQKNHILYPAIDLTLAITCYLCMIFHNQQTTYCYARALFSWVLVSCIVLGCLGALYLGDLWVSDLLASVLLASALSMSYWLCYRKTHPYFSPHSLFFSITGFLVLSIATALSCYLYLKQNLQNHQIYFPQHIVSHSFWWNQEKPLLPLYSRNRIGKISGTFNIQYVGNIKTLVTSLTQKGWKIQKSSLLNSVLKRMNAKEISARSLNECFYLNRPAVMTMTFHLAGSHVLFRLQLWQSNFYLYSFRSPIWIGHIQQLKLKHRHRAVILSQDQAINIMDEQLSEFVLKTLSLPSSNHLSLPPSRERKLLLIQAP